MLDQAKKFTELLLTDSNRAYLQVGVLVSLAVEKAEQGRLFDVLSLLLAERLTEMIAREKNGRSPESQENVAGKCQSRKTV